MRMKHKIVRRVGCLAWIVMVWSSDCLATNTVCSKTVKLVDGQNVTLGSCIRVGSTNMLDIYLNNDTNAVILRINASRMHSIGYDYTLTPDRKILWLISQRKPRMPPSVLIWQIDVFLAQGEKPDHYRPHRTRRSVGGNHMDVITTMDLSSILRQYSDQTRSGEELVFEPGCHLSNVSLISSNSNSVTISGKIGRNHIFKGDVFLDDKAGLVEKDFQIMRCDDKKSGNETDPLGCTSLSSTNETGALTIKK